MSMITTVLVVIFRVVSPSEAGAEAEIRELDVASRVNENVVRLDIPVNKSHGMHAGHCADQLGNIKPRWTKRVSS